MVEAFLARFLVPADTDAGVAGALGSFGVGIQINGLRDLVVAWRLGTWQIEV